MDEIIKRHQAMVAERLTQSFSPVPQNAISKAEEGFDDIEKARVVRQDGDIHPNGKWVWSSQAAGGKGDWRVIKKPKDGSPAPAPAKKETKSAKAIQAFGAEKFDVYENISWPRGYIRNEIEDTEAALRHIKEGRHDLVDPSSEGKFRSYLSRLKDIEKMMRGALQ